MHKMPKFAPIVLLVFLSIAFAIYLFTRTSTRLAGLSASGTIEAYQVVISPDLGGRVLEVAVDEGESVKSGELLIRQDASLLKLQQAQAEAVSQASEAAARAAQQNEALLKAGPSKEQLALAQTVVDQAQVGVDAAQQTYDDLSEPAKDTPSGKQIKQQVDRAKAGLANAKAQYDLLANGARTEQKQAAAEQTAAAQAQAAAARAAVEVLKTQIARMELVSPVDGVVLSRAIQPGEMAAPGAALLVIGKSDGLKLTVYVPEDRYGQIQMGEIVVVRVDSFPGEVFHGKVSAIAEQAEFTPRNVQTSSSRKTTVFAVRLTLDNSAGKLKPGMPADVELNGK